MAIKVDLGKAYVGSIGASWKESFWKQDLRKGLLSWFYSAKSTSLSILWNGEKLDAFATLRGLSQVDPLTPYFFFFFVCMELFGHSITEAVQEDRWNRLKHHEMARVSLIYFLPMTLFSLEKRQ